LVADVARREQVTNAGDPTYDRRMRARPDSEMDFERAIREHLELKRLHAGEPAAQDDELLAVNHLPDPPGTATGYEDRLWGRAPDFDWGD
jgi:hypothetical protein